MPRRTYSPRDGRRRAEGTNQDWTWLLELLRSERQHRRTHGRNPATTSHTYPKGN